MFLFFLDKIVMLKSKMVQSTSIQPAGVLQMKSLLVIILVIILIFSTVACSVLGGNRLPSNVVFSDDFSNTKHKWDKVNETNRITDYFNDAFHIVVNEANTDAWSNPGDESFTDVTIEVDATKNAGPEDNDFGIVCRYTEGDQFNFYYAVISSDGYYSIMKMSNGVGRPLGKDSLLQSEKIKLGTSTNHLRFDCIGTSLTFSVNGNVIDQQTDTEYAAGNVGLIAGTFDTIGADIIFDNFIVYKP
jgi:hypothetical protein